MLSSRRLKISAVLVLLAAMVAVLVHLLSLRGPASEPWEPIALPSIGAELLYLDAAAIVKRGPSRVVVLRLNEPVELIPHHFRAAKLANPEPAERWREHLNAPVVFNAGQFDENLNHLGWLKSDNRWLSRQRKEAWKGLLVSGPLDGGFWGRVVDLELADGNGVVQRYAHAVQSMMLVDEHGRLRVRDSEKTACRTVVAEDTQGRLLIMLTEGATTLADLARWLPQTSLNIVRAMNLDGGVESQLVVHTPEFKGAFYGQYGTGTSMLDSSPGQMIRFPIPAVVALQPGIRENG